MPLNVRNHRRPVKKYPSPLGGVSGIAFWLMALLLCVQLRARAQVEWPVITGQTKPWTRWWWMGNAVDKEDLVANLSKYAAAGLGGLELTPIYGVRGYEGQIATDPLAEGRSGPDQNR